jgi:CspA family cold shock protein
MLSQGVVREWDEDQGFGVIDSADTPGGCWAWFSSIVMDGLGVLTAGEPVAFTWEAAPQDGYEYRAVLVWPPGVEVGTPPAPADDGPSAAYQSTLTIQWADGTVETRSGDEPRPWSAGSSAAIRYQRGSGERDNGS